MKLDEAIDVLTDFSKQESELLGNEFREASALLIEAGKREMGYREFYNKVKLVPSETK